jgi:hypothetical protein
MLLGTPEGLWRAGAVAVIAEHPLLTDIGADSAVIRVAVQVYAAVAYRLR